MRPNVLIIDDSTAIHSLLRARLKDEPIALHCATAGQQGLDVAAAIVPDLILLDVEMPGLDGFEVCRRLKDDPALMGVPVIFLTGAASIEQKLRGLDLGAVDYITKPFDPAELRARVRAALRMKFMTDLLAHKAQIDALTGLWNRRYFDQRLEAELSLARRASRPVAVILADIDLFKVINERYGHPTGDEVLRGAGSILGQSVRIEDIVCRFAGEEFAVIAPNADAGAAVLAERLRQTIQATPIPVRGQELPVTASFGVAWASEPDATLVSRARQALDRAKRAGRNRVEIADAEPVGAAGRYDAPPT